MAESSRTELLEMIAANPGRALTMEGSTQNERNEVRKMIDEGLLDGGVSINGKAIANLRITDKGREFLAERRILPKVVRSAAFGLWWIVVAVLSAAIATAVTIYVTKYLEPAKTPAATEPAIKSPAP